MRVLIVSQWFDPEPTLVNDVAHGLTDMGDEVRVLTGMPHYPRGKIESGYRWYRNAKEVRTGIPVTRSIEYPSRDASALRRALTYSTFSVSGALSAGADKRWAEVVLVYASPLTAAIAGRRLLASDRPVVLHVQDLWPDAIFDTNMGAGLSSSPAREATARFCNYIYRSADRVIAISPSMAQELRSRGVKAERVQAILNWADEGAVEAAPPSGKTREALGLSQEHVLITYAGNLGPAQNLDVWIDAAKRLNGAPVDFLFFGEGVERERLQAMASGLSNVRFLGLFLDQQKVNEIVADSDVMAVSLADSPSLRHAIPGKVQTAFLRGKPILASAGGATAEVVEGSQAGIAVPADDIEALIDGALQCVRMGRDGLGHMGRAGLDFYRSNMSRAAGLEKLRAALREAAG